MAIPVWSRYFLNISACFFLLLASSLTCCNQILTSSYPESYCFSWRGDVGEGYLAPYSLSYSFLVGDSFLLSSILRVYFFSDALGGMLQFYLYYYAWISNLINKIVRGEEVVLLMFSRIF
jgi:hypothetical protein